MGEIKCSVKEALELLSHMNKDDEVILTVNDTKNYVHLKPKRIKVKKRRRVYRKSK